MPIGDLLSSRRLSSRERLDNLHGDLSKAEELVHEKACVYLTGSFGRGEASAHSDLDIFIAGQGTERERSLSRLDEILVKAELIDATRRRGFPEFSGDGEYLAHYTIDALAKTLGKPDDDAANTFTARLLLLLESRPLLENGVYWAAIREVIAAYWRDYEDHKREFPASVHETGER